MGTTQKFHPVSLPLIRGCAAKCGFVLGRINQRFITPDKKTAVYFAPVNEVPPDLKRLDLISVKEALNGCYSSDVWVRIMWITRSGQTMAEIITTIDERNSARDPFYWTDIHPNDAIPPLHQDVDLSWLAEE